MKRAVLLIGLLTLLVLGSECAEEDKSKTETTVELSGAWRVLPDGTVLYLSEKNTTKHLEPRETPEGIKLLGGEFCVNNYTLLIAGKEQKTSQTLWEHELLFLLEEKGTYLEPRFGVWDVILDKTSAYVLFTSSLGVYLEIIQKEGNGTWRKDISIRIRREYDGVGELVKSGKLVSFKSGVYALLEYEYEDYTDIWRVYPEPPKRLWKSAP